MILFGAGHVEGEKIWKGYSEDKSMFDLAQRKAKYAAERYGQKTKTFYVTGTSYPAVEAACKGCTIASWEHSDAFSDTSVNHVSIFRTVENAGDGPCAVIGKASANVIGCKFYVKRHKNSQGKDGFGVIGRAMRAGCKDSWLHEHGFHTHPATRAKLADPTFRQRLAVAEVDAMAVYYGWKGTGDTMRKGDKGASVGLWQKRLLEWNPKALPRYKADNSFGGETVTWTENFQRAVGLSADGVVGPATWNAMVEAIKGDCAGVKAELAKAKADALTANNKLTAIRKAVDTFKTL